MIFVVETEEHSLRVFLSEAEAVAHCEGLDVEAGVWLFWDDRGEPLDLHARIERRHRSTGGLGAARHVTAVAG